MHKKIIIILLMAMYSLVNASPAPYTGQQQREIKALSDKEIKGLLAGSGMGMVKAAELNHYPGPLHVLELAEKLKLSDKQLQQTKKLFNDMKQQAIVQGKKLVKAERKLDKLFATEKVTAIKLRQQLLAISNLQAELRYTHLVSHLKQRAILTKHQIMQYDKLRGYGSAATYEGHHHEH